MTDLFVDTWGAGTRVVLVHGSLATGVDEWQAQRPLADEGFELLVPDRRGYGKSPSAPGEDFLRDADDIVALMGDGAHLVGHSYGGLGVLFAAARRPEATLSIALLEPGTFTLGQDHPDARRLVDNVRELWGEDLPDDEWVVGFLRAVGSDPDALPPELVAAAVPLVPVFRRAVRSGTTSRRSRRSPPRASRSWWCQAATMPGSTPCATTSPGESARRS